MKTFNVQTREGQAGIWLCVSENGIDTPIAKFFSEADAKQFTETLAVTRMTFHTMGALGI